MGGQVGDLFAVSEADPGEYASAGHTRPAIRKLYPRPGDPVLTNRRRPILTVREDTSPGRHDCCTRPATRRAMHRWGRRPGTARVPETCSRPWVLTARRWSRSR